MWNIENKLNEYNKKEIYAEEIKPVVTNTERWKPKLRALRNFNN